MSRPPRTTTAGTFFITAITANRRRLFQVAANAEVLLETLQHYRREGLYKLHAFVVMPDHMHLLLTTADLPKAMKHLRGAFSRRLASSFDIWQRGYTDHLVQTREDFLTHRDYIHQNPIRAHICKLPEEYAYSSAQKNQASEPSTATADRLTPDAHPRSSRRSLLQQERSPQLGAIEYGEVATPDTSAASGSAPRMETMTQVEVPNQF